MRRAPTRQSAEESFDFATEQRLATLGLEAFLRASADEITRPLGDKRPDMAFSKKLFASSVRALVVAKVDPPQLADFIIQISKSHLALGYPDVYDEVADTLIPKLLVGGGSALFFPVMKILVKALNTEPPNLGIQLRLVKALNTLNTRAHKLSHSEPQEANFANVATVTRRLLLTHIGRCKEILLAHEKPTFWHAAALSRVVLTATKIYRKDGRRTASVRSTAEKCFRKVSNELTQLEDLLGSFDVGSLHLEALLDLRMTRMNLIREKALVEIDKVRAGLLPQWSGTNAIVSTLGKARPLMDELLAMPLFGKYALNTRLQVAHLLYLYGQQLGHAFRYEEAVEAYHEAKSILQPHSTSRKVRSTQLEIQFEWARCLIHIDLPEAWNFCKEVLKQAKGDASILPGSRLTRWKDNFAFVARKCGLIQECAQFFAFLETENNHTPGVEGCASTSNESVTLATIRDPRNEYHMFADTSDAAFGNKNSNHLIDDLEREDVYGILCQLRRIVFGDLSRIGDLTLADALQLIRQFLRHIPNFDEVIDRFCWMMNREGADQSDFALGLEVALCYCCFPAEALTTFARAKAKFAKIGDEQCLERAICCQIDVCKTLRIVFPVIESATALAIKYSCDGRVAESEGLTQELLLTYKKSIAAIRDPDDLASILARFHVTHKTLVSMNSMSLCPVSLFTELDSLRDWRLVSRQAGADETAARLFEDRQQLIEKLENSCGNLALSPSTFLHMQTLSDTVYAISVLSFSSSGHVRSDKIVKRGHIDRISEQVSLLWKLIERAHLLELDKDPEVLELLSELSEELIRPIRSEILGNVYIIADEFFSRIPFQVIPDFFETASICRTVSFLPSAQSIVRLTGADLRLRRAAAFFGLDQDLNARLEVESLAKQFSPLMRTLRESRNPRRITRELETYQEFGLLHIVGHANRPEHSKAMSHALRLDDENEITPEGLRSARGFARFYVLNGCYTGHGYDDAGDQLGFAHAVFSRRASGCLVTRCRVNAKWACEFGIDFSSSLGSGLNSFSAFRMAAANAASAIRVAPFTLYGLPCVFQPGQILRVREPSTG